MTFHFLVNAPYSHGTIFYSFLEVCALGTGGNQCYDDTGDLSDPSTLYTSAGAGSKLLAPALAVNLAWPKAQSDEAALCKPLRVPRRCWTSISQGSVS